MPSNGSGVSVQSLIDSIPNYVLVVDSGHRIVMANQAVAALVKADAEDIIGGYCPTVLHGSDGPVPYCPLELAATQNAPSEVETCHTASGRWVKSVAYPIRTQDSQALFLHMLVDIDALKQAQAALEQRSAELKAVRDGIVGVLSKVVEMRCPYTAGHQQRVSILATAIAHAMHWPADKVTGLGLAAELHDLGKIAIPTEILNRPGKLTPLELSIIRAHSETGYQMLAHVSLPWPIAVAVRQHHERLDGSGYPYGLQGDSIIPEARILAVADVAEAMRSRRSYRPGLSKEAVQVELVSNRGILYDPEVVDAYLGIVDTDPGSLEMEWADTASWGGNRTHSERPAWDLSLGQDGPVPGSIPDRSRCADQSAAICASVNPTQAGEAVGRVEASWGK
jgi:PAS domain S-box-containing protein